MRLISADILKLKRRRGMVALVATLTFASVALYFAIGGDGGAEGFDSAMGILALLSALAGAIFGATAGGADIESGVFRDLAATGRSRLALFGARVTGAWAVVLPIVAVTGIALGGLSIALAGTAAAPGAATLVAGTAGLLAAGALSSAVAVGLSAVVGSRGPLIGILLAFFLAIEPLLAAIGFLGDLRQGIPSVAIARIGHMPVDGGVQLALGTAVAVAIGWAAVSIGLGAWKTKTREI